MRKIGVCIVTYNEEKYIAQAIESALAQECEANVVIYVGNDCSTDRTGIICKELASKNTGRIVYIENYVNLGLVGNTKTVLDRIIADRCDYVAMLDGDDYWTDRLKLQKQLTFLEAHRDYGFVHTNQDLLYNEKDLVHIPRKNVRNGYVFDWAGTDETAVANCTAFFRTELLSLCKLDDFISYGFKSVDYTMYIIFMKHTKFFFMDDFTAVWRRGHSSVSGGGDIEKQIRYLENGIQQWKYLATLFPDRYPYSEENGNEFRARNTMKIAYRYGDFERAKSAVLNGVKPNTTMESIQKFCARYPLTFKILYTLRYKKKLR